MKINLLRFDYYFDRVYNRFRNIILSHKFGYLDHSCYISKKSTIIGSSNIFIGAKTRVFPFSILQCSEMNNFNNVIGSIRIGSRCSIQPYAYINALGGNIFIGDDCSIHPYTILYGQGNLRIGNKVRIAANVVIIPANHIFSNRDVPIMEQGLNTEGILIEDDVWIGAGVTITDGVKIGKGSVIAAGSVVTKEIPPYQVWAGVPARLLKDR